MPLARDVDQPSRSTKHPLVSKLKSWSVRVLVRSPSACMGAVVSIARNPTNATCRDVDCAEQPATAQAACSVRVSEAGPFPERDLTVGAEALRDQGESFLEHEVGEQARDRPLSVLPTHRKFTSAH